MTKSKMDTVACTRALADCLAEYEAALDTVDLVSVSMDADRHRATAEVRLRGRRSTFHYSDGTWHSWEPND